MKCQHGWNESESAHNNNNPICSHVPSEMKEFHVVRVKNKYMDMLRAPEERMSVLVNVHVPNEESTVNIGGHRRPYKHTTEPPSAVESATHGL